MLLIYYLINLLNVQKDLHSRVYKDYIRLRNILSSFLIMSIPAWLRRLDSLTNFTHQNIHNPSLVLHSIWPGIPSVYSICNSDLETELKNLSDFLRTFFSIIPLYYYFNTSFFIWWQGFAPNPTIFLYYYVKLAHFLLVPPSGSVI